MTYNEFVIKTAEMILNDWRDALKENDMGNRFGIPGDTVDISYRAFQKAKEIADDFYSEK